MFNAENIKSLLKATPFNPFRICLSDGKIFEIKHPEMAWPTARYIEVGVSTNERGTVDEVAHCAVIHIARLETIDANQPA